MTTANPSVVYDAVDVSFNTKRFLLQLLIHFGYPFSIFWSPNMLVQGFKLNSAYAFYFNHVLGFLPILMMISYYMSPDAAPGSFVCPLAMFCMHKFMVAVKYASMSDSEYERLMALGAGDAVRITTWSQQLQLVQGLLGAEPNVLLFEIAASARRLEINLSDIVFDIPVNRSDPTPQIGQWLKFTSSAIVISKISKSCRLKLAGSPIETIEEKITDDDFSDEEIEPTNFLFGKFANKTMDYPKRVSLVDLHTKCTDSLDFQMIAVPGSMLSLSLLTHGWGESNINRPMNIFMLSAIMMIGALPFLLAPVSNSLWTRIFYASSSITLGSFLMVLGKFLQGCLFYASRQLSLARALGNMVTNDIFKYEPAPTSLDCHADDSVLHFNFQEAPQSDVPFICLQSASNVFSWNYTRSLLQSFGLRFKFRLDAYMGSLLAIMFVLIMASLISLLTAEDPMSNFQNIMFLQTQILVFFICTNLVLIILTGSTSNGAFQSHRNIIIGQNVKIRFKMAQITSDMRHLKSLSSHEYNQNPHDNGETFLLNSMVQKVDRLQETVEALSAVADMIESGEGAAPLSILGVPCTYEVTYSLVTSLLTYFVYLLSYIYGANID